MKTNKEILDALLIEIDNFSSLKIDRTDFALSFIEAIESLDEVPFTYIDEARDWQYRLETAGDTLNASTKQNSNALKHWVKQLITEIC